LSTSSRIDDLLGPVHRSDEDGILKRATGHEIHVPLKNPFQSFGKAKESIGNARTIGILKLHEKIEIAPRRIKVGRGCRTENIQFLHLLGMTQLLQCLPVAGEKIIYHRIHASHLPPSAQGVNPHRATPPTRSAGSSADQPSRNADGWTK